MDRLPAPNAQRTAKPYFSLALSGAPSRAAPVGHERFQGLTGWVELTIEVRSDYLYAGSGLVELAPDGRAYAAFSRRGERLALPATGLKGAVRAIVEAISNSCVSQRGRNERLPGSSHQPCPAVRPGEEAKVQLCPACRIFGATGWRGRVQFTDGVAGPEVSTAIVKIGALWAPRLAHGRKFYVAGPFQRLDDRPERNYRFIEAVPKGSRFTAQLRFENMATAELGVVARGLGLDGQAENDGVVYALTPKLGGAKPRCLGAVRFQPTRLFVVPSTPSRLLAGLAAGGQQRPLLPALRAWLDDRILLNEEAWEQLKSRTRQGDLCPQGMY